MTHWISFIQKVRLSLMRQRNHIFYKKNFDLKKKKINPSLLKLPIKVRHTLLAT